MHGGGRVGEGKREKRWGPGTHLCVISAFLKAGDISEHSADATL